MTNRMSAAALCAATIVYAGPAFARMAPMDHSAHTPPAETTAPPEEAVPVDHAHMPGMEHMAGMDHMSAMQGAGSGTSRLPDSGAMHGVHIPAGDWAVMLHGQLFLTYSDQGGPRGGEKAFFTSHVQVEAHRPLSGSVDLQLRGLFSADPLIGDRGYPLLFATGETAGGRPLVDRQHPHDLIAELSARLDFKIGGTKLFLYGGPAAEPALGPSVYLHRASAQLNPETPITHHWFDSTHLSFGVVTAGISTPKLQLEASAFRGREPDEVREDIETPRLDSWSVRASWNPAPAWSASLSYGRLKSVEVLHPDQDESRLIATVAYTANGVAITGGYGRKDRLPGRVVDAWFLEGQWDVTARHAVFGRFENVNNDELFPVETDPLHDRPFRISKFALGYAYKFPHTGPVGLSVGALGSLYAKPDAIDAAYGKAPKSFVLFARLGLGH